MVSLRCRWPPLLLPGCASTAVARPLWGRSCAARPIPTGPTTSSHTTPRQVRCTRTSRLPGAPSLRGSRTLTSLLCWVCGLAVTEERMLAALAQQTAAAALTQSIKAPVSKPSCECTGVTLLAAAFASLERSPPGCSLVCVLQPLRRRLPVRRACPRALRCTRVRRRCAATC